MKQKLNKKFVVWLSQKKNEPKWMLDFRINAFKTFEKIGDPTFGPKLNIDFSKINYYKNDENTLSNDWDKISCNVKKTFKNLGVVDAEEKYLDGVSNQFESEVIYHKNNTNKNIIFTSTDDALQKYPELLKKYFNKLVKYQENKYTALNSALWSGGSFIYIPPHTKLDRPLQSYFRIESESLGQFERTIIIVDDYSELDYIEGCTAKSYATSSLHAGVVEIYVGKHSKCRYITIQNWSKNVYNLVTKRSIVDDYGFMEWIDGNLGSLVTMKYPCSILKGDYSIGNSLSIAYAKNNQIIDAGAKMIHIGSNTRSNIVSKSIAENGGESNYRGLSRINKNSKNSISKVKCDTLIIDKNSKSNTYPKNILENSSGILEHEATISKLDEKKLKYLMSKGLDENDCKQLIILGFISDLKSKIPLEYAVELNRLIKD